MADSDNINFSTLPFIFAFTITRNRKDWKMTTTHSEVLPEQVIIRLCKTALTVISLMRLTHMSTGNTEITH